MDEWELDSPTSRPVAGAVAGVSSQSPDDSARTPAKVPASPPPAKPKGRNRRWFLLAASGVVMLFAGLLGGFYLARSYSSADAAELRQSRVELSELQKAQAQSELRNWDYYRLVEALRAENEALKAGSERTPSSGGSPTTGADSYGEGVYVVGEGILPGVYDGVVTREIGYWARLSATDGSVGSIVANEVVRGPFVVTVNEADMALELWGVEITPR